MQFRADALARTRNGVDAVATILSTATPGLAGHGLTGGSKTIEYEPGTLRDFIEGGGAAQAGGPRSIKRNQRIKVPF